MTEEAKPAIVLFGDLVEKNGKTIRENNSEKQHECALGDVVEIDFSLHYPRDQEFGVEVNLEGMCRLYIVAHQRDCDGTPLYMLSDIPVLYPKETPLWSHQRLLYRSMAHVVEHGYGEGSIKKTGKHAELYPSISAWLTT
jgi:hypothetical protein